MKKRSLAIIISGLAAVGFASAAQAGPNFCYHLSNTTGSPAAAITANGFTAITMANLTAADLLGCDELWILNNNGIPDAAVTGNTAAITAFVNAGHTLSFHDRNVNQQVSASTYLPGAGGVTFVSDFGTEIDIQAPTSPVIMGPWGTITEGQLDGGNYSDHGYATLASLPGGTTAVLSTGDATHIVDFTYSLGAGRVYYSTIPLDFYFAGGNDPPRTTLLNVYARNEAAFQGNAARVPEPATLALLGLGLAGLGLSRRRKAN